MGRWLPGDGGERGRIIGGERVRSGMLRRVCAGSVVLLALALAPSAFANTFTVTTPADSGPGSLRQAILDSNANLAIVDTIRFDLAPSSSVILPASDLPPITDGVVIDGTLSGAINGVQQPRLVGSPTLSTGIQFNIPSAAQAQIRGITITNFQTGLDLGTDSVFAAGNFIGTDSSGTDSLGNSVGVKVAGASLIGGNTVADRNVISNNQTGISITGSGTVVSGNYIGPKPDGETAFGGSGTGITVNGGSNLTIGGTLPGAGNVIAGLSQSAIVLGNTTADAVSGNVIGLSASQSVGLGVDIGVELNGGADSNALGTVGAAANVISNTADVGVIVHGGASNTIDGNFIGTDSTGTPIPSVPNEEGVRILGGSGNTFSHNRISTSTLQGIEIAGGVNTFSTNRIDANAGGGITVVSGGSTIGPGNTIIGNTGFGVQVSVGNGTRITQNSIDGTVGGLGIDLVGTANNGQGAPLLTSAAFQAGNIQVQGSLTSTPSTSFVLEFFRSPTCSSGGAGEGATYIGSSTQLTDSGGNVTFTVPVSATGAGSAVTATATDPSGNTSEFSVCAVLAGTGSLGGTLASSTAVPGPDVNLSALGTEDWAVWGSAANGTSTSLAPNARKLNANEISSLTNIDPAPSVVLRGLGQFPVNQPFYFGWANGSGPMSASHVAAGLQHDGETQFLSTLNHGFGFTVPADTRTRTLRVYVATNRADGTLTATLSDGSAAPFVNVLPQAVDLRSAVYTITYAAASANQTLHVEWVESADNCSTTFQCDNAAIYAVALEAPNTYVVNTAVDHTDGTCDVTDCSLREAITAANSAAAPGVAGITFAIPGGDAQIAVIGSPLPAITVPVAIDGTTHPGDTAGTMGVTLNGDGAGAGGDDGLVLAAGSGGSTIRGLAIRDFDANGDSGIRVQSDGNQITGNYIGTTNNGTGSAANQDGVVVEGNHNTVGGPNAGDRNVISGNSDAGVLVKAGSAPDGNVIAGNYVGLDTSGQHPLANGGAGVQVAFAAHTIVGGAIAADGNVISGNHTEVLIGDSTSPFTGSLNTVQNNVVGLLANKSATVGAVGDGVAVMNAGSNTIADNMIGGESDGIRICGSPENTIVRNLIGSNTADPSGPDFGVFNDGVAMSDGPCLFMAAATQNVIGGAPADGNTVLNSGGDNIAVNSNSNVVSGNTVRGALGAGIGIQGSQNTIGPANVVRDNGGSFTGVAVISGVDNRITQNSINANLGLGIDLNDNGVDVNDPGDGDSGANGTQNYPVLTSATRDGSSITIGYDFQPAANQNYTVEFFKSPACDGSGHGEGETYLGADTVHVDSGGLPTHFTSNIATPAAGTVVSGDSITATATDPAGNTSEFSTCAMAVDLGAQPLGVVSIAAGASSVTAGAPQVQLNAVPPSLFFDAAAPLNSAPVGSIPVGSIPVGSIPVNSIPVGSIPVSSIGLSATQSLLSSIALSTIPLVAPSSWATVLAGTPFAGVPLQNVTLGQVLANSVAAGRLASVPVGSINLQRSQLGSLTPAAIGLGSTPVGSIPVPPADGEPATDSTLQRWCAWLSGPPLNCTSPTSLSTTTMVSAALQGAPVASIPVGSIPVNSIPVNSIPINSIPVGSIKLGNIPVGSITVPRVNIQYSPVGSIPVGSIPVNSIPVGSIPVGSIPVSSISLTSSPVGSIPVSSIPVGSIHIVFNCTTACPTSGTLLSNQARLQASLTLEQLLRNTIAGTFDHITFADVIGATLPSVLQNYTVAQLINSLPPNSGITYADVLALLLNPGDLSWENLTLTGTPIQNFSTGGSTLAYHADFHLSPNGGPSGVPDTATIDVTVPDGFLYQAGTTQLTGSPTPPQPGDPTVLADGTLRWTVNVIVGTNYSLLFTTRPGLTLGPTAATATITPTGGVAAAAPAPAPVTVGDTLEPNDTPATAKPIAVDANGSGTSFYLSYLTSKSDVDYYSFPVPAAGSRVTFHLSHLPADYDLVVYGPAGAGQALPVLPSTPPIDGQPLADSGFATTHSTDPLAPQTLNDVTLAQGLPVYGVSTLRGTQDDAVTVISSGEVGNYTVQVSGFNGATSDNPYMLRAETTPPPVQPTCAPRTLGNAAAATNLVTTTTGQVASEVNTLFVVDDQQLSRIYASGGAGASVLTKLNSAANLAGYANAGFPAAVVHVDANAAVSSAFAAWNACPSDPAKANATSTAIASVLATVRATYKNVEYLVLVGGDDALPFWRLDDLTTLSTENGYAETFPSATALGGSLAAAKMLSDDPYGTTEPVPYLNGQLDVPDLVTGRLVETPANINAQLDAFLAGATPGHLHPATALTTGYDFLADGASAVSTALGAAAAGTANKSAINDTWTKSTLIGSGALLLPSNGAAAPDIVSLNAHADHNHFKPAAGTDLFSASEAAAATQTFGSRLVFSMGCHAGLSVFDAFVASNNLDWAQLFAQKGAAAYVANTGFGYGDSSTIAYSEDLNRRFAQGAVGGLTNPTGADLTVGEALTVAKQAYKGDLGIVGVYDQKAMAELTLYGLPMYRIGGSGIAPPPAQAASPLALQAAKALTSGASALTAAALALPAGSFPSDPSTGLHVESFTADRAFGAATSTSRGSYYTGNDGVLVEHLRPIEPKAIEPVTIEKAHGALLTELTSQDVTGFDPVYARPIIDSASAEPEVGFDDLAFPSKLQAVTTFKRLQTTKQQVVLAQGQFFSTNPSDGLQSGTQRLFTHENGVVFSSTSNDYAPPVFSTLDAQVLSGGQAAFAVGVTDRDGVNPGVVKRVLVAYKDAAGGVWHFVDLAQSGTTPSNWSAVAPLNGTHLQYFVQAVDANGNVAVSTNKGLYYQETPPTTATGGVDVQTAAAPPPSGWFNTTAGVVVTVDGAPPAPGVATLSIDGGAPLPYTGPVTVTGDGLHTATAQTATGSDSTIFLVDSSAPAITFGAPAANLAFEQNQSNTSSFTCTDAGIGVQSCSGPSTFDTASLGFHNFSVTATDLLGHAATRSITYGVIRFSSPAQGASVVHGASVNADFSCGSLTGGTTCTATVTRLTPAPAGSPVAITSGQPLPTSVAGTYSVTVTLSDSSGHSASLTHIYTVGGGTSISGQLVFTRGNRIWTINPNGTGLRQVTGTSLDPGAAFDDQPAKSPDGTKIVFARRSTASGASQLWVIDADGVNPQQLTTGAGDNTAPAWSPDGRKIAFQSTRTGSNGIDVWVGDWSALPVASLSNLVNLTSAAGDDTAPAWSPASVGKIAFASNRSKANFDVYTMSTTGGPVLALTSDKATDREPTWSPDGSEITFSSDRATSGTPNGFEIYVMGSANGHSQNRLTTIAGDDKTPFWLDANRIVFSSAQLAPAPLGGLAIIAPTGGASTKIANTVATDGNPG